MELTLLILEVVAIAASIGDVTSFSTSSGLAPTSVVTTITYGRFIAGSRSVVILVSETTPKTITRSNIHTLKPKVSGNAELPFFLSFNRAFFDLYRRRSNGDNL